ncbi:MAG: hypothetical protein U1E73_11810 [Planctomycetota bacterium]
MSASLRLRAFHRWLGIAFTLGVLANVLALALGPQQPPTWVYLLALIPLGLLEVTGLCLIAQPFAARRHRASSEPGRTP